MGTKNKVRKNHNRMSLLNEDGWLNNEVPEAVFIDGSEIGLNAEMVWALRAYISGDMLPRGKFFDRIRTGRLILMPLFNCPELEEKMGHGEESCFFITDE